MLPGFRAGAALPPSPRSYRHGEGGEMSATVRPAQYRQVSALAGIDEELAPATCTCPCCQTIGTPPNQQQHCC